MDPNQVEPSGTPDQPVYCTPDPRTDRASQPEYYAPQQPEHASQPEPEPVPVESEAEPEPEVEYEPPRRRGRSTGQTYREKVKDPTKRRIEFGPDGNKKGPASSPFANFLGETARDHVPINYENWKKVPDEIKNRCWEKIQVIIITYYLNWYIRMIYIEMLVISKIYIYLLIHYIF